jgi:lipopolysaccharide export LptBFGC system permease protein LptF
MVFGMAPPNATGGAPPTPGNQRAVGGLVLLVAVVLLVSSVAWFSNHQAGVAIGQILVALILGAVGVFFFRQSRMP